MTEKDTRQRPARTWTDFVSRRWRNIDRPKSNIGKIALERFLKENDLPHVEVLKVFPGAGSISLNELPAYFVLKPASMWSGIGVMLLHKIAGLACWYDAKSRRVMSADEIVASMLSIEKDQGKELDFIAEIRALDERIDKAIPLDYKVFTFYDVHKFILQVDRNYAPPRMSFFDGNFDPIDDDRVVLNPERPGTRGEHRKPDCWREILSLARSASMKLEGSFMSVDCYATPDGPLLGELTHTPGGPWYRNMYMFSDEFDLELGDAWRQANEKLGIAPPMVKVPYQITAKGKVLRIVE